MTVLHALYSGSFGIADDQRVEVAKILVDNGAPINAIAFFGKRDHTFTPLDLLRFKSKRAYNSEQKDRFAKLESYLLSKGAKTVEELKAEQGAVPQPGEILLSGTVVSIDAATNTLTLKTTMFSLPTGAAKTLDVPKEKSVVVSAATSIHTRDKTDKLTLNDLKADDIVIVVGADTGDTAKFAVREIVVGTK